MIKPRILVVGDAVACTGFSRVLHSILERLESGYGYEIHHLGTNYLGDPHDSGWDIYPARLHGDIYGANRLGPLIEKIRPQLVFLVNDLWVLKRYMPALERHPEVSSVIYFPVDAGPMEPEAVWALLPHVDRWLTYTDFAASEVRTAIAEASHSDASLPRPEVGTIPHGIDEKHFFPIADRPVVAGRPRRRWAARQALFPGREDLLDGFIVLNANRNQPRKRIDATIEGFALFARQKPDNVKLYLHMAREDGGWDIRTLARRFGVADRLLVTSASNRFPDASLETMNLIYNACDVGVNTSSAEGWGLVSFEHAATGAAQVVPRHTSQIELWRDAAAWLEPRFLTTTEVTLTEAYLVAPEDVAEQLERLYADTSYRAHLEQAALRNVTQARYRWDSIAKQWDEVFSGLLRAQGRKLPLRESSRSCARQAV